MHSPAEETLGANAFGGSHSQLQPLREIGGKFYGLEATEETGIAGGNPSGHSIKRKEVYIQCHSGNSSIQKLPLSEGFL
jgi:hypothetical protein